MNASRPKLLAVAEVLAVLVLFVLLGRLVRGAELIGWQKEALGAPFLSNALLFFGLPTAVLFLRRQSFVGYGLVRKDLGYHASLGATIGGILLPATMLFPVVMFLELDPKGWRGGSLLAAGFALAGLIALAVITTRRTVGGETESPPVSLHFVALVALALLGVGLGRISPVLARTVYVLFFVACLEEFFFRGYVQGRLNQNFKRPFSLFKIPYGVGAIGAAVSFGLMHPIMSAEGTPWPWALWTGAVGFVFALAREKTGAVAAPAVAHGMILLPQVLFAA